jgi:hypothetical protein
MFRLTRLAMLFLVPALVGNALRADDAEPTPQQIAEIRRHIRDLDADNFEVRETASRQLWLIGPPAIPFLEEVVKESNPEVRYRAQSLLKSIQRGPIKAAIESYCAQPDETLDLEQGMWLMSRIGNPALQRRELSKQFDDIAALVQAKLGKDVDPATTDPQVVTTALRQVIFDELKFNTNKEDYDNPENCYPDRVLATRKGRPVFVAHVVVAVAKRLKAPIVGLPVSGMYSAKYDGSQAPKGFPKEDIVFYPHDHGRVLSREELVKMFGTTHLETGSDREVLVRMLGNLTSVLDHKPDRAEELQLANEMRVRLQRTEMR